MGYELRHLRLARTVLRDATVADLCAVAEELRQNFPPDTILLFKLETVPDGIDTQFLTIEAEGS